MYKTVYGYQVFAMPPLDQRKSYRYPVDESRQHCELVVGRNRIPATLLDESAGGFSILVCQSPGVAVRETVELETDGGWFLARVVYIGEVEPNSAKIGEAEEEELDSLVNAGTVWFRLGLRRLGEVQPPPEPMTERVVSRLCLGLGSKYSSGTAIIVVGVILAVLVVALPWGIMAFFQHRSNLLNSHSLLDGKSSTPWTSPDNTNPVAEKLFSSDKGTDAGESHSDGITSGGGGSSAAPADNSLLSSPSDTGSSAPSDQVPRNQTPANQDWHRMLRRLSGAAPLLMPEVIRELKLTDSQQESIRALHLSAAQALHEIDQQSAGKGRQETSALRARRLLESREEAVKLLDSDQQKQWTQLLQ